MSPRVRDAGIRIVAAVACGSVLNPTRNEMTDLTRDEVYQLRRVFEECVAVADNEFQSRE